MGTSRVFENQWARLPSRTGQVHVIQIIGGQVISEVDCIKYVAEEDEVDLTDTYDPDTDETYPDGMGRAWLWLDGQREKRVLVRHDFTGATAPLIGGWVYVVRGIRTLTIASGTHTGEKLACYLVTFPI